MSEDRKMNLVIKTTEPHSSVDVVSISATCKPKYKSLNYNSDVLVCVDSCDENIAIYEQSKRRINIHMINGTLKSSFDSRFDLNCFSFHQNRWLIGLDCGSKIAVYDLNKDRFKTIFDPSSGKIPENVTQMSTSANDKYWFMCHSSGQISSINTSSKEVQLLTHYTERNASAIAASPWQCDQLALGCINGTVALYDIDRKVNISKWMSHESRINGLSFSRYNDRLFLSAGSDNRAILFDTNQKSYLRTFSSSLPITACAMSADIFFSFADSSGTVSIFDLRNSHNPLHLLHHQSAIDFLRFDIDRSRFITNNSGRISGNNNNNRTDDLFKNLFPVSNSSDNTSIMTAISSLSPPADDPNQSTNSSVFSVDDDQSTAQFDNNNNHHHHRFQQKMHNISSGDSFNISHFVSDVGNSNPVSTETAAMEFKQKKSVKFEPDCRLSVSPNKSGASSVDSSNPVPSICEDSHNKESISNNGNDKFDLLRQDLVAMEARIKNDLLLNIIDQLAITEKNITEPLLAVMKQNRELVEENERLRAELKRLNYHR